MDYMQLPELIEEWLSDTIREFHLFVSNLIETKKQRQIIWKSKGSF